MTRSEILRRFPKASEGFIRANLNPDDSGICPAAQKPVERMPLDADKQTEEADWHNAAKCFEVAFIVYSVRPADYDGYDIKALQDFLVKAGIIEDDRWDILAGRVVSRKASTQGEEKTIVKISTVRSHAEFLTALEDGK